MTYYTYMIECENVSSGRKTLYTGYTNSIMRRFQEHSSGRGARYTKGKDLRLVFFQKFRSRRDAMAREREIKKMPKRKKVSLIKDIQVNDYLL